MEITLKISDEMGIWAKPTSGDVFAPYNDPENYLEAVFFHSKFDYFAEAATATVAVTHPSKAGVSGQEYLGGMPSSFADHVKVTLYYGFTEVTRVLLTHNLGYVPDFLIADEDYNELPAGIPVQYDNVVGAGQRFVTHYATTTQIVQVERIVVGPSSLASISKTYRVVVFRKPEAVAGADLFKATLANIIAGTGKLNAAEKHLRRAAAGESAFSIPLGRNFDIKNGQVRYVRADGFWIESIGAGGADTYTGSFLGSGALGVVA